MSDEQQPKRDLDPESRAKMKAYKKEYWERYRETRRRVYGTLSNDDYDALERRAKEAGRSVWHQLHGEAEAYAKQEYLPSKSLEKKFTDLITQFRRIGTNLNQIARDQKSGKSFDHRGYYYALEEMEAAARALLADPRKVSDDGEDDPPDP